MQIGNTNVNVFIKYFLFKVKTNYNLSIKSSVGKYEIL